jgi:hypothetical protein
MNLLIAWSRITEQNLHLNLLGKKMGGHMIMQEPKNIFEVMNGVQSAFEVGPFKITDLAMDNELNESLEQYTALNKQQVEVDWQAYLDEVFDICL